MKKNRGFTLIELVAVIVILGILAVIAAPKFLNLQDDAHKSRSDGVFSAFTAAVNMYHGAWILQGEPSVSSGVGVIFADETIYPSNEGFPLGTTDYGIITNEGCGELWNALLNQDLTIEPYNTFTNINADIQYGFTTSGECFYSYVSDYNNAASTGNELLYSPTTGETYVKPYNKSK